MKKARKSTFQKQSFVKRKIESCLNHSILTKKKTSQTQGIRKRLKR